MLKKLKKLTKEVISNDVVIRAFKTAVQAFVAVLIVTDSPLSRTALAAAGAAAISAAWNSIKEYRK
jgi:hypothetical protein